MHTVTIGLVAPLSTTTFSAEMVTAQTAETGVAFIHDSSSFLNWNCLKLSAILEVVGVCGFTPWAF